MSKVGKVKDLKKSSQQRLFKMVQTVGAKDFEKFKEKKLDAFVLVPMQGLSVIFGNFLHYAILYNDIELVKDLCAKGASVNPVKDGWVISPLQYASDCGRAEIVQILIDNGAIKEGVTVDYAMSLCTQPLTFVWGTLEKIQGRTVNYKKVAELLEEDISESSSRFKPN